VKRLQLVWSWGMTDRRTESQPLVHDGVMFLNQSSSIVQALDASAVWYGSLVATGGELVFGGDVDRWFSAFDARTPEILWRTRLAVSAQGYPVSYEVNGRQYLAVPAGVALAIPTLTPEIRVPTSGSLLSVFAVQE
jgi:alcohol dehydrogenase (cytochrome c)